MSLNRPDLTGIRTGLANIIIAAIDLGDDPMSPVAHGNILDAVHTECFRDSSKDPEVLVLHPITVYCLYVNTDTAEGRGSTVRQAVASSYSKAQEAGKGRGPFGTDANRIEAEAWWQDQDGSVFKLENAVLLIETQEERAAKKAALIQQARSKLNQDELDALGL